MGPPIHPHPPGEAAVEVVWCWGEGPEGMKGAPGSCFLLLESTYGVEVSVVDVKNRQSSLTACNQKNWVFPQIQDVKISCPNLRSPCAVSRELFLLPPQLTELLALLNSGFALHKLLKKHLHAFSNFTSFSLLVIYLTDLHRLHRCIHITRCTTFQSCSFICSIIKPFQY